MKQEFKIVLLGDGAVGKTTYLKYLKDNIFEKKYIGTMGVEIISFKINNFITFNIWDCAGDYKFAGNREDYCKDADACIIMFTNKINTYYNELFKRINPNSPIIYVKNKVNNVENIQEFIQISVKNKYNLNAPINRLENILCEN